MIAKNSATQLNEAFEPLLTKGVPFYLSRGLKKEDLDAIYVIAYNLYSEKEYVKALQFFQAMAFYNHFDKRGWIGSAACYQILGSYDNALLCYSYASLIDAKDPLPLLHSVECYIALKRNADALGAVEAMLLVTQKNPDFDNLKNWAMQMKEVLLKAK
jgi:type III secretion system low calcium response chaperone LcrH/SycD